MKIGLVVALVLFAKSSAQENNLFKEYEHSIFNSKDGHQGTNMLLENLMYGKDTLKEISIHCPGPESPVVTIKDMIQEAVDEYSHEEAEQTTINKKTKCMTLRLTGANFNMKLEINCDDTEEIVTPEAVDSNTGEVNEVELEEDLWRLQLWLSTKKVVTISEFPEELWYTLSCLQ